MDILVVIREILHKIFEKGREIRNEFQIGDQVEDGNPVYEKHSSKWIESVDSFREKRDEF